MIIGECRDLRAILFVSLFAGCALLTGIDHATDTDMIARFETLNILSDACYAADDLMTRHDRVRRGKPARPVIADGMQVRMAYAAVKYLDGHVVRPRIATKKAEGG